ncbi:hypothetical protein [Sphingosinicella sp. BN140058]|uniref:DMP19 family protein n=1 Tax=Sphingosinicella sp. BN140058 TaxID=1892855 RepID=UPI001012A8AF|nr:hypothetical protein [Sphingosinicella sp. BN140058]QAY76422.1 hypothetical protein ETR14_07900 [Sphingosinicella sp. BN140058]
MTDTRPVMTGDSFDEAAAYVDDGWWMTGESLIHLSAVMNVEGWNLYGHPGHLQLTPAQRTLMMWSDIVGQVSNGGFTQYCDNYARDLALGVAAVEALHWPELRERFGRAMAEQAGDAAAPRRLQPVPLSEEPEKWAKSRKRLIRHLAQRGKTWWQPTTARDLASIEALHPEWRLELLYQQAVLSGELASGGERVFDFEPPPTYAAEAFDTWFYSDDTKRESVRYVHAFILRNRDQLYRES